MRTTALASVTMAALAVAAATAPASAQQNSPPQANTENEREFVPANEIVCRRTPPPPGTRIGPRRICKTQAEWDAIQAESRQALERVQHSNRFGNQ